MVATPQTAPKTVFQRIQLLVDKTSRIVVASAWDGPRTYMPEVSEDLSHEIFYGLTPTDFRADNCMSYTLKYGAKGGIMSKIENPQDITKDIWDRLNLHRKKIIALGQIRAHILWVRRSFAKNITLQDVIYRRKAEQALAFKQNGYPDDKIYQYPFVQQYAKVEEITNTQAADMILFKAEDTEKMLIVTENLRLQTNKQILQCATIEQVDQLMSEIQLTMFLPGFLP